MRLCTAQKWGNCTIICRVWVSLVGEVLREACATWPLEEVCITKFNSLHNWSLRVATFEFRCSTPLQWGWIVNRQLLQFLQLSKNKRLVFLGAQGVSLHYIIQKDDFKNRSKPDSALAFWLTYTFSWFVLARFRLGRWSICIDISVFSPQPGGAGESQV